MLAGAVQRGRCTVSQLADELRDGPIRHSALFRTVLTGPQLTIPLAEGRLALGTWQGIFLFEHRTRPHRREVVLHLIGE